MCRDRLCLARALQHEQLWENRDGLQEDGERPENLLHGEAVVDE